MLREKFQISDDGLEITEQAEWVVVTHFGPQKIGFPFLRLNEGVVVNLSEALNRNYMEQSGFRFSHDGNIVSVVDTHGNTHFSCFLDGISGDEIRSWYEQIGELPFGGYLGLPRHIEDFSNGALTVFTSEGAFINLVA